MINCNTQEVQQAGETKHGTPEHSTPGHSVSGHDMLGHSMSQLKIPEEKIVISARVLLFPNTYLLCVYLCECMSCMYQYLWRPEEEERCPGGHCGFSSVSAGNQI